MNSNFADLIYLDPPFNTKRFYSAPIGSKAAGSSFKDMWTWDDVNEAYLETLAGKYPALARFIGDSGKIHSKAMSAYLTYMTQRVIEMYRVLKDTGSLYLHCDPTASHYLKILLDEIFGKNNFRNEIVWERTTDTGSSKAKSNRFPTNSDIILFYSKNEEYTFNKQYYDYSQDYLSNKFISNDNDGKGIYRWQVLRTYSQETFDKLKSENRLKKTESSKYYYYKQYFSESKGVRISNIWNANDIIPIGPTARERTGYPTQKPLALLHRIIKTSSNAGDIVLDPFCGCATTCVAAQQLGRKWIGIDIEKQAVNILVKRLSDDAGLFKDFINTKNVPQRTDVQIEQSSSQSVKERLYKEQKGICNGCKSQFEIRNMEIDHIVPKSKGGGDYYENYQLLCGSCNRIKGSRPMEYLRMRISKEEELLKDKIMFGE